MRSKKILKHEVQNEAGQGTQADPIDKEHTGNKKIYTHTARAKPQKEMVQKKVMFIHCLL